MVFEIILLVLLLELWKDSMARESTTALNAIHRQAQLGRIYNQAEVARMAIHHFRNVVELYDAAPADVKKAAQTAYEEALSKLIDLEGSMPVAEPKQEHPHGNEVLLWLYKYKNISKLRGYGKIR
jgi:hypothetical protein